VFHPAAYSVGQSRWRGYSYRSGMAGSIAERSDAHRSTLRDYRQVITRRAPVKGNSGFEDPGPSDARSPLIKKTPLRTRTALASANHLAG
jgi:hypothetical protein